MKHAHQDYIFFPQINCRTSISLWDKSHGGLSCSQQAIITVLYMDTETLDSRLFAHVVYGRFSLLNSVLSTSFLQDMSLQRPFPTKPVCWCPKFDLYVLYHFTSLLQVFILFLSKKCRQFFLNSALSHNRHINNT